MKKSFALPLIVAALAVRSASAQVSLFSTQGDFTGWSGTSGQFTVSAVNTPDLDGGTINGLANTSAPGTTGTAGSLSAQWTGGTFDYVFSQGEQGNAPFLAAVENAQTLILQYTTPPAGTGNYYDIEVGVNYQGGFDTLSGTTTSPVDGVTTLVVPFAAEATKLAAAQATDGGTFQYFQIGFAYNSNFTPGSPFNIDGIGVTEVPEPGTLALCGLGAVTTLIAARRRKA